MLGAGVGATGFLHTAQTLPFVLFAIPAGLLADRRSRRAVMVGAEALRALSLLAIVACASMGWLSLPLLAALGFVGACGTVAYSVAAPALVPSLVPSAALAVATVGSSSPARWRSPVVRRWPGDRGVDWRAAGVRGRGGAVHLRGVSAGRGREPAHAAGAQRDALHEIREGANSCSGTGCYGRSSSRRSSSTERSSRCRPCTAVCRPAPRPVGGGGRRHAGHVRCGHDRRRAGHPADHARAAVRSRRRARPDLWPRRRALDGADDLDSVGGAGRPQLLSLRRGADRLGHQHGHAAPDGHPRGLLGRVSAINITAYGRAPPAPRSARSSAASTAPRRASSWPPAAFSFRRSSSSPRPCSSWRGSRRWSALVLDRVADLLDRFTNLAPRLPDALLHGAGTALGPCPPPPGPGRRSLSRLAP